MCLDFLMTFHRWNKCTIWPLLYKNSKQLLLAKTSKLLVKMWKYDSYGKLLYMLLRVLHICSTNAGYSDPLFLFY